MVSQSSGVVKDLKTERTASFRENGLAVTFEQMVRNVKVFPNRFEGFTMLEANPTARLMKGMVRNLHVLHKVLASIEHLVASNASVPARLQNQTLSLSLSLYINPNTE